MWPVSEDAKAAFRRGGPMVTVLRASTGAQVLTFSPESGKFTVDLSRKVSSTFDFEVVGEELSPDSPGHPLSPFSGSKIEAWVGVSLWGFSFGSEFTAEMNHDFNPRGVRWAVAGVEWIPAGVYTVISAQKTMASEGAKVSVAAEDASARLNVEWPDVYRVASGTTVQAAVEGILAGRGVEGDAIDVQLPGWVTPALALGADGNTTVLDSVTDLAAVAGHVLYVGRTGKWVSAAMTSQGVAADLPAGVLLSQDFNIEASSVVNGVVVRAEGSGVPLPVRAERWDDDPASPFARTGPVGESPFLFESAKIVDVRQATALAAALYDWGCGVNVELSIIPQPWIDAGDEITVGGVGPLRVKRVDWDVSGGAMRLTCLAKGWL